MGIIEADKIGSHPNLLQTNYIICDATNPTEYPPVGISSHKTNVAGVIQSTNATYRGIAPNINIVDGIVTARLLEMELMAATDCTINYASATNMSFGFETNGNFDEFARYLDRVVYETGATIVVAASDFCNRKSGSPDIAFNVINVGSFGDNNTTSFADDIVPCTNGIAGSYLNPDSFYMDRKEPDVVAPGVGIITTGRNGSFETFGDPSVGGTSAAAPHVTAGVGLLTQRKPDLFSKAAEVRAIIMASARHNLEGDSRLSDRDGAGGVMLAAADAVVANGLSDYITNDGSAPNFPISKTFTATSGQKVRVAIAQGKNGLVDIR